MEESPNLRRQHAASLAILVAAAVILATVFFVARSFRQETVAKQLNPHDAMSIWRTATPEQKRATAETILTELRQKGLIGYQTLQNLDNPDDHTFLVDQLIESLDATTDHNRPEYASPGQSIYYTSEQTVYRRGWNF